MFSSLAVFTCVRLRLLHASSLQSGLLCHISNSRCEINYFNRQVVDTCWLNNFCLTKKSIVINLRLSPLLYLVCDSVRKWLILSEGMAKEIPAVTFRVLMPMTSPSCKTMHLKYCAHVAESTPISLRYTLSWNPVMWSWSKSLLPRITKSYSKSNTVLDLLPKVFMVLDSKSNLLDWVC